MNKIMKKIEENRIQKYNKAYNSVIISIEVLRCFISTADNKKEFYLNKLYNRSLGLNKRIIKYVYEIYNNLRKSRYNVLNIETIKSIDNSITDLYYKFVNREFIDTIDNIVVKTIVERLYYDLRNLHYTMIYIKANDRERAIALLEDLFINRI